MSFFKRVFGIFAALGFVSILLIVSFMIVNLKKDNYIYQYESDDNIEIFQQEEINNINIFTIEHTLKISVEFKEDKEIDYALSYGYHYYDKYLYVVNLTIVNSNNNIFVTIINDENSSVLISDNL